MFRFLLPIITIPVFIIVFFTNLPRSSNHIPSLSPRENTNSAKHAVPIALRFESATTSSLAEFRPRRSDIDGFGSKDKDYAAELAAFNALLITDYTAWHIIQRTLCERDPMYVRGLRLLVYQPRGYPGLGDQIRALISAFYLAVFSQRLLLIDMRMPFPLHTMLGQGRSGANFTFDRHMFEVDEHDNLPANTTDVRVVMTDWSQNFPMFFEKTRVVVLSGNPAFRYYGMQQMLHSIHENVAPFRQRLKEAGLAEFSPDRLHAATLALAAIFRPTMNLRERIAAQRPFPAGDSPYISLHARLGHGLSEFSSTRFNLSLSNTTRTAIAACLANAAAMVARRHNTTDLFFSTDTRSANELFKRELLKALPGARVRCASPRARHIHWMSRTSDSIALPQGTQESFDDFAQVFVDVSLLSAGKALVFLNSGFARVAGWLGAVHDLVPLTTGQCADVSRGLLSIASLTAAPPA